MAEVILHIGTHKTGTTSLQAFMRANREGFAQQGIGIPYTTVKHGGISLDRNANFLTLSVWDAIEPGKARPADKKFIEAGSQALRETLATYPKALLSDEKLWFRGAVDDRYWAQLKQTLHGFGVDRVKVIVYFRRQDQFITSLWSQYVKGTTREQRPLKQYARTKKSKLIMDYDRGVRNLENQFGKENIVVRVFDRKGFVGGDLYHDFCDAIGCTYLDSFEIPQIETNPSLNKCFTSTKRIINKGPLYLEGSNVFSPISFSAQSVSSEKTDATLFGGKEAAELVAGYEKGNRRIAKDYFGRRRKELFEPVDASTPKYDLGITQPQEDIIRLFSEAIAYEDARIAALEKRNSQLQKTIDRLNRQLEQIQPTASEE